MGGAAVFIVLIAIGGGCGMIVAIVWLITRAGQQEARTKADVQNKLIDKFGTAPELVEFLKSPAGQQFVSGVESVPKHAARQKIISGARSAIILTFIGLAFITLAIIAEPDMVYAGVILLSLGLGFAVSTFVSLKLSKSYGLLDGDSNSPVS